MQDSLSWVYDFFSQRGELPGKDREAQISVDIFDNELVDSFGIVELVAEIESGFAIELTPQDLEDSRFRTIQGLAEIIDERVGVSS